MRIEIWDLDIFKKMPVETYFDPIFNQLEVEYPHMCGDGKYLLRIVIDIKCIDFPDEYYKFYNGKIVKLVKLFVVDYETNEYVLKKAWSDIKEWEYSLPDRVLKDMYPDFFANHCDLITYNWHEVEEYMDTALEERIKKDNENLDDLPL